MVHSMRYVGGDFSAFFDIKWNIEQMAIKTHTQCVCVNHISIELFLSFFRSPHIFGSFAQLLSSLMALWHII